MIFLYYFCAISRKSIQQHKPKAMKKIITSCLAMAALAVGVATTLAQQQRVTTTKQKVGQRIETRGQASSRLASLRPSVAFAVTQPEKSAVTSAVVPGANTMFGGLMVYSDKWQTSESTPALCRFKPVKAEQSLWCIPTKICSMSSRL